MAIAIVKNWQFAQVGGASSVNRRVITAVGQTRYGQDMFLLLKQLLCGFPRNPWTVVSSSNATVANSSDNWAAYTDITGNSEGNVHSWIVLKQAGLLSNFQLLINVRATSFVNAYVSVSPSAGYSGGTTTAKPTASDEVVLNNFVDLPNWNTASDAGMVHAIQTADGQCTRIYLQGSGMAGAGVTNGFWSTWFFERVANPCSGWTNPWIAHVGALNGTDPILNARFATRVGSVNASVYLTVPSASTSYPASQEASDLNPGGAPIHSVGVASTTPGARGLSGVLYDLWLGPPWLVTGAGYPEDGGYQLASFGRWLIPWNGTRPRLA